ncbi:hypothetical protein BCR35DRAFT_309770 [Leucosporidium creatinivorum]|uniref:Uncharacterized protein n=1 Tax=Leucosporidium creatinivorum TaxID=106004 RepID=A0A1Y2DCI3_9BASI|nr:hypothetical protein BCR35DRAFT_309770 [Leucosporidium creatinivorum]
MLRSGRWVSFRNASSPNRRAAAEPLLRPYSFADLSSLHLLVPLETDRRPREDARHLLLPRPLPRTSRGVSPSSGRPNGPRAFAWYFACSCSTSGSQEGGVWSGYCRVEGLRDQRTPTRRLGIWHSQPQEGLHPPLQALLPFHHFAGARGGAHARGNRFENQGALRQSSHLPLHGAFAILQLGFMGFGRRRSVRGSFDSRPREVLRERDGHSLHGQEPV